MDRRPDRWWLCDRSTACFRQGRGCRRGLIPARWQSRHRRRARKPDAVPTRPTRSQPLRLQPVWTSDDDDGPATRARHLEEIFRARCKRGDAVRKFEREAAAAVAARGLAPHPPAVRSWLNANDLGRTPSAVDEPTAGQRIAGWCNSGVTASVRASRIAYAAETAKRRLVAVRGFEPRSRG
jgi:hypothetical protein